MSARGPPYGPPASRPSPEVPQHGDSAYPALALGLAIFSALATARTTHLLAAHAPPAEALTAGFQRALVGGSAFVVASAFIALRVTNTRGEAAPSAEPAMAAHRRS